VDGDERVSYAELDARVNRVARVLSGAGVAAGERVAPALRNRAEFFEVAWAAARLGAEVVPVAWRAKDDEVAYVVRDAGARLLVREDDGPGAGMALSELRAARATAAAAPIDGAPDPAIPAFRYYTSGTTGRPKAVERERSPADRFVAAARALPTFAGLDRPAEVHLACGPLYHTAPCAYAQYGLLFGHTVVVMERFDAARSLELVERERVTWTHMVPINFVRIIALGPTGRDLSSIRRVLHGAAPCPPHVKRAIMAVFPPGSVWEYYGMTEGLATVITAEEWGRKPGSVGRAAAGTHVSVRGPGGRALGPGEIGLVYLTPSARFSYAGDEAKTAEAWDGDAFTVGDMGFLDSDGYLFLTDRAQDLIISGGANVYPAEVEAVLCEHPAVSDCAVVGVPDDEWGESVLAIIEVASPLDAGELIAFARERLAHYKCPRAVVAVDELPRDPNGKVRKRELRDRYWAGRATRI